MSLLPQRPKHLNEAAIWQDVEFGSYAADLPLWEELAAAAKGSVLELGAGSGRVTLALAGKGVSMVALERDPDLVEALKLRAAGLPVVALVADVARPDGLPPGEDAPEPGSSAAISGAALAIAPLQLIQLLDEDERHRALTALAEGLEPGGRCALTLVDESTLVDHGVAAAVRPDMRELEGWVYSSEPLWVQVSDASLRMRRLRERVSPSGDLVRKVHDDVLHRLGPDRLEEVARAAGMRPVGRRRIASSTYEAGSIAVILEVP